MLGQHVRFEEPFTVSHHQDRMLVREVKCLYIISKYRQYSLGGGQRRTVCGSMPAFEHALIIAVILTLWLSERSLRSGGLRGTCSGLIDRIQHGPGVP